MFNASKLLVGLAHFFHFGNKNGGGGAVEKNPHGRSAGADSKPDRQVPRDRRQRVGGQRGCRRSLQGRQWQDRHGGSPPWYSKDKRCISGHYFTDAFYTLASIKKTWYENILIIWILFWIYKGHQKEVSFLWYGLLTVFNFLKMLAAFWIREKHLRAETAVAEVIAFVISTAKSFIFFFFVIINTMESFIFFITLIIKRCNDDL